jgi:chemotaxis response regulator CheB
MRGIDSCATGRSTGLALKTFRRGLRSAASLPALAAGGAAHYDNGLLSLRHPVASVVNPLEASFPVVGVGASAGGLEAFTKFLEHLPLDTGMAFVLVQHLDPQHESVLSQILTRATSLPVHEVTNNLRVRPNNVYVIPPNSGLSIRATRGQSAAYFLRPWTTVAASGSPI